MTKKFLNWALVANIATAILSVIFAIVFYIADQTLDDGTTLHTIAEYLKGFFDLIAVFTGYGTIMYAFYRYDFKTGLKSIGIFGISVALSFIYQVIGTCIFDNNWAGDFIVFTIYYACGSCFITQFLPALIIALCTHLVTKNGTSKNTMLRLELITSGVLLGINIIIVLCFNILTFLIENDFLIYADDLGQMFLNILDTIIKFGPIQFGVYFLAHFLYGKYTDNTTEATRTRKNKPTTATAAEA